MGLPFQPEPVDQLTARFNKALDRVVDVCQMGKKRPGMDRTHVFDFEDGLRMIISIDDYLDEKFLHLSGSLHKESDNPLTQINILQMMAAKMTLLNGKPFSGIGSTTISASGVVHLVIPLNPEHIMISET